MQSAEPCGLTPANFTFRKESISEEPFETVQKAKKFSPSLQKKEGVNSKVMKVTNSVLTVHKSSDGKSSAFLKTTGGGDVKVRSVAKKHTGKRSSSSIPESDHLSKKAHLDPNGAGG